MCRLCTILLFLLVASTSIAANQPNRVALVIGNAAYKEAPLRNPVNDARAIGQTPQRPDFQVTTRLNADHDAMQTAVVSFADRPEYYQAYLERYPNGAFAPLARLHIDRLAGEAPTASSSAFGSAAATGGAGIAKAQPPESDPQPAASVTIASAQPPTEETSKRSAEKLTYRGDGDRKNRRPIFV